MNSSREPMRSVRFRTEACLKRLYHRGHTPFVESFQQTGAEVAMNPKACVKTGRYGILVSIGYMNQVARTTSDLLAG